MSRKEYGARDNNEETPWAMGSGMNPPRIIVRGISYDWCQSDFLYALATLLDTS
jgi:hypothetical protein